MLLAGETLGSESTEHNSSFVRFTHIYTQNTPMGELVNNDQFVSHHYYVSYFVCLGPCVVNSSSGPRYQRRGVAAMWHKEVPLLAQWVGRRCWQGRCSCDSAVYVGGRAGLGAPCSAWVSYVYPPQKKTMLSCLLASSHGTQHYVWLAVCGTCVLEDL